MNNSALKIKQVTTRKEKTVQIVYKLDIRGGKRIQMSMMFFIFLPPFLSLLLTPDVEKFIHALTDLCTSDNNQVKGACVLRYTK